MRLFDLVGALSVVAWTSLVGAYVHANYFSEGGQDVDASVVFTEGESWMLLTREEEEVGYIHEARTPLETDGWLLEYDILFNVSMLGVNQHLRTDIKASVDEDAILESFSAEMATGTATFELTGEVDGNTVVMTTNLGGAPREQRLELKEPPRLSNSALNQLVAQPEKLTPGTTFEQEYFDPTVMGTTTMKFEYVREHVVTVYDEEVPTFHFRQIVGGTELDSYVDKNGEVYIQEFPLRILGARMPAALGRARAQSLRTKFENSSEISGAAPKGVDLSVESAVAILKGTQSPDSLVPQEATTFRLTGIPTPATIQLASGSQKVVSSKEGSATVDTAKASPPQTPPSEEELASMSASTLRVDADHDIFTSLLSSDPPEDRDELARALASAIQSKMTVAGEVGIQTASQALEKGSGDCTEYALALVAALRHHGFPARFASGVRRDEDGKFIAHQWAQYWNGTTFVDLDATSDNLEPRDDQIQFVTHTEPEHPEFVHLLDQLEIEVVRPPADGLPVGEGGDGDFN